MTVKQQLSLERFLTLPETKPAREYARGEVTRKPMPTNAHALLQAYIWMLIFQFVTERGLGRARIEWRCIFGLPRHERAYVPDVTFASFARMARGNDLEQPYLHDAPDLVEEALSPGESARRFAAKLRFYLQHGVRLMWVVDPASRTITVYEPGQDEERVLRAGDTIEGGDVLPGFRADVAEIMAQFEG